MAELFPLADLRDPLAFLRGARIPLHFPNVPTRYEWCVDRYLWTDGPHWWSGDMGGLLGPSLALDLTNEDTARWVDRKIAEQAGSHGMRTGIVTAVLGASKDYFFLTVTMSNGDYGRILLHPNGPFACLASITPIESNIPTARAALLRALFGRETK